MITAYRASLLPWHLCISGSCRYVALRKYEAGAYVPRLRGCTLGMPHQLHLANRLYGVVTRREEGKYTGEDLDLVSVLVKWHW